MSQLLLFTVSKQQALSASKIMALCAFSNFINRLLTVKINFGNFTPFYFGGKIIEVSGVKKGEEGFVKK